jgi:thiol:disulfide interchange protein DsbA
MYRSARLRLTGLLFIGLITAACSSEEPAAPAAAAPATAAPEPVAEAPAAEAPAADDAAPADEESVVLAQAMDEAETDGESAAEGAEESIRLATAETPEPAVDERFKDGTHYRTLPVAQPTSAPPDKVEVAEVFWYGCPHCYTLEPHIQAWKAEMPADAQFVRMPASLNRGWQIHARVFYTAEALGVLDEVHEELFREIHGKGNPLNTEESLVDFFGRYGISEEQFMETFNSFAVQTRLRQSDSLVRRYRITGVPAVVVNGKYVTGADMAGGETRLFEVVNFLVEKESG